MKKLYTKRTNKHGYFDVPFPIQEEKLCEGMEYNIFVELVVPQDSKVTQLKEPILNAKVMNNKQNWVVVDLVAKRCLDNGMVWYLDDTGYHYAYIK